MVKLVSSAELQAMMHQYARENASTDQFTLGTLIDRLEAIKDKAKDVVFDFAYMRPTEFISWRGIYSQLALSYTEAYDAKRLTAGDLLELAKDADGKTFQGYKSGDYIMDRGTPLWVANYGDAPYTIIHDLTDDGYEIRLHTRWEE